MTNQSISFKSNIRFVNYKAYLALSKKNYINYLHTSPNILKSDSFYSMAIRSCTGGGLVNPGVEAEGFHFWDDRTNKKKFPELVNSLFRFVRNPQNALIVGSKELPNNPYSIEQFERFKNLFLERVKNVSIFQKHQFKNSETHYHYSLDTDTWTLCTGYNESLGGRWKYLKNPDKFLKVFDRVSISEGDRLFIGKKEVLPTEYPELFQSTQNKQKSVSP